MHLQVGGGRTSWERLGSNPPKFLPKTLENPPQKLPKSYENPIHKGVQHGAQKNFVFSPYVAPPGRVLGGLGGILAASWGALGVSWGRPGASWGILGASWRVLGASWGVLGASWGACVVLVVLLMDC